MMLKSFTIFTYSLFFLSFSTLIFSQEINSGKSSSDYNQETNAIPSKNSEENSSFFSWFNLNPNLEGAKDHNYHEVLAAVKNAKKSADNFDQINLESDTLFKKALEISRKAKRKDLEIYSSINYAFYLYHFRKYRDSFPYFMFCMSNLNDTKTEHVIEPLETYRNLAYFLITANENDYAILFLRKAEQVPGLQMSDQASLKDALGNVFLNKNKLEVAQNNFEAALLLAKKSGDHLREAKALGNIAEIYFRNGNYLFSVDYLKRDIEISEDIGNDQNSMFALTRLCKVYLKMDLIPEAKEAILEAEKYANSKPYFQSSLYEINEYILQIAKREKNSADELRALRTLDNLKESLKNLDGKEVVVAVNWNAEKMRLENDIVTERKKLEQEATRRNSAILVSILLTVVMILIIHTNKIRRKARQEQYENNVLNLTLEKIKSENTLNATTKTISSYKNYLFEKNNQIKNLENELIKIQSIPKNKKAEYELKLEDLLKSHLLTLENWNQFKTAFKMEKPDYTAYLETNFPELTDANLRVIYLTQLGLSNSEIARILGVTIAAVKKAKQRLRLKYEDKYEQLFDMIA